MDNRLVVFDLDGTLNQTHLYSVKAQRCALEAMGVNSDSFSNERLIACLGKRGEDYARELLPDRPIEDIHRLLALEIEWENRIIHENCACYEGIVSSLKRLKEAGYLTGVCSNSKIAYIQMVLNALEIDALIDVRQELIEGLTKADTLRLLLERIKPDRAVMVGDRIYDMEAARNNGIPFIGCLYGYAPEEVMSADVKVITGADIFDAVKALIG